MNKPRHTPGPWAVSTTRYRTGNIEITKSGGDAVLAVVQFISEDVTEANARLIAAAPELLSAFKYLFEYVKSEQLHLETADREYFENLLTKATGGGAE